MKRRHIHALTALLRYKESLEHYGIQSKIALSPKNILKFSVVGCDGDCCPEIPCGSVHLSRADKEWIDTLGTKVSAWIEWKIRNGK